MCTRHLSPGSLQQHSPCNIYSVFSAMTHASLTHPRLPAHPTPTRITPPLTTDAQNTLNSSTFKPQKNTGGKTFLILRLGHHKAACRIEISSAQQHAATGPDHSLSPRAYKYVQRPTFFPFLPLATHPTRRNRRSVGDLPRFHSSQD
jgi:hypothetical protein